MSSSSTIAEKRVDAASVGPGLALAAGFFFSFRIVLVFLCVRLFGADPRTGTEVSLALNFFLLALVCFHSLGAVNYPFRSMWKAPSVRWIVLFLAISCCSLAWSGAASLPVSSGYWCALASDVAVVALLLRNGPVSRVAGSMMKGFVWSACLIALIAWIMPAQKDLRLGDEDFFNTNQIGNLCVIGIFFAQYLMRRKDGNWAPAIAFLAITVFRSLSKATIVAFVLSESYLIIQDKSMRLKTKIILAVSVLLAVLASWGLFAAYYEIYTTAGNQAETLTGRTAIWAYVLSAGLEQPWFGHGFDSMWKVVPPFGAFEARHAENELLQQFYSYGIAGTVMLAGLYGSLYRQFRKVADQPVKIVLIAFLFYIVIRGLAEAEPFDLLFPLWTAFMTAVLANSLRGAGGTRQPRMLLPGQ